MARQTATQTQARTETERQASVMIGAIDRLIDLTKEQIAELRAATDGLPATLKGAPGAPAPQLSRQDKLDELGRFLSRLTQVKDWLIEDPRMLPVVDAFIGDQVRQMAAKDRQWNVQFALVTMVVGALLGWLLSAVGTPGAVLHLVVH
jgi:hypothetical protein